MPAHGRRRSSAHVLLVILAASCARGGAAGAAGSSPAGDCPVTRMPASGSTASAMEFEAPAAGGACRVVAPALAGPPAAAAGATAPDLKALWTAQGNALSWTSAGASLCRVERSRDDGATWALVALERGTAHLDPFATVDDACAMDRYRVACQGADAWSGWGTVTMGTRLASGSNGLATTPVGSPYVAEGGVVSIDGPQISVAAGSLVCVASDARLELSAQTLVFDGTVLFSGGGGGALSLSDGSPGAGPACPPAQMSGGALQIGAIEGSASQTAEGMTCDVRPAASGSVQPGSISLIAPPWVSNVTVTWSEIGNLVSWETGSDRYTLERSRDEGDTWTVLAEIPAAEPARYLDRFDTLDDLCAIGWYRVTCTSGADRSPPSVARQGTALADGVGVLVTAPEGSPYVVSAAVRLDGPVDVAPGTAVCLRPGAKLTLRDDGLYDWRPVGIRAMR